MQQCQGMVEDVGLYENHMSITLCSLTNGLLSSHYIEIAECDCLLLVSRDKQQKWQQTELEAAGGAERHLEPVSQHVDTSLCWQAA